MHDRNDQVGWTDAQWNRIRQAVSEEAGRARVAGAFLPMYGPLPRSTQVVPSERFDDRSSTVDDTATAPLLEISTQVSLSQAQVQESDLSTALQLFRRATNVLARLEDWTIFNGRPKLYGEHSRVPLDVTGGYGVEFGEEPDWGEYFHGQVIDFKRLPPTPDEANPYVAYVQPAPADGNASPPIGAFSTSDADFDHGHGFAWLGERRERMFNRLLQKNPGGLGLIDAAYTHVTFDLTPASLISAVVGAMDQLERDGHVGPFVCVLGSRAFDVAHQATGAPLVFARDRIEPLIGRSLMRSSAVDDRSFDLHDLKAVGLVLSPSSEALDLAMAVDAEPEFLFVDARARYQFRVRQRFALRLKQPTSVVVLQTPTIAIQIGEGIDVKTKWHDSSWNAAASAKRQDDLVQRIQAAARQRAPGGAPAAGGAPSAGGAPADHSESRENEG